MTRCTREYKTRPDIRGLALELTQHLHQKDYFGEIQALFDFVQNRVRYIRDVNNVETIQTPSVTLENRAGDCDDKSSLLAAMLESIGHPTRFKAVGFEPGQLEHVYVETKLGSQWIALDATEPNDPGWEPPGIRSFIYSHN